MTCDKLLRHSLYVWFGLCTDSSVSVYVYATNCYGFVCVNVPDSCRFVCVSVTDSCRFVFVSVTDSCGFVSVTDNLELSACVSDCWEFVCVSVSLTVVSLSVSLSLTLKAVGICLSDFVCFLLPTGSGRGRDIWTVYILPVQRLPRLQEGATGKSTLQGSAYKYTHSTNNEHFYRWQVQVIDPTVTGNWSNCISLNSPCWLVPLQTLLKYW